MPLRRLVGCAGLAPAVSLLAGGRLRYCSSTEAPFEKRWTNEHPSRVPDRAAGYKPVATRSLTHQALHPSATKNNSVLYQSNAQLQNASLHAHCEPNSGLPDLDLLPPRRLLSGHTLQIIDAGISPAPGSARPLSPIPPASRPLLLSLCG
jgi:hypothetical protein